jgi:hypothetical protein
MITPRLGSREHGTSTVHLNRARACARSPRHASHYPDDPHAYDAETLSPARSSGDLGEGMV